MVERFAFLVPGFPAHEGDTTCLPAVQTYVRAFARRHPEVDVRVFAFQYPQTSGWYEWNGISVFAAAGSNRGGMRKLATWRRIWRHATATRPLMLHSFWIGECALIGELLSRRYGIPHVASVGGQELRKPSHYSRLLSHGRYTLTAGSTMAADTAWRTLCSEVAAIIPLGLDTHDVASVQAERVIDVVAVGSLIPLKRFDVVLDVARGCPDQRFVIVGDGPERQRLRDRSPRNVEFAGSIPRESVLDLMRRSRILLHPSEYESQGYVFLEALASGLHVVCRNVGAPGHSDKVHRCSTSEEMLRVVRALAGTILDHTPAKVPTVGETVSAFERVYGSTLGGTCQRS